jgi:hypothetical protein
MSLMTRLLVNVLLGLFAGWVALLDHCLIVVAGMPVSGEIAVLLVLQAGIFAVVMLLANGALSAMAGIATNGSSIRMKLLVFGLPLILFLISPAMISDSMYRARYGNINKFVVHAHVWHDLACCLNPFSAIGNGEN